MDIDLTKAKLRATDSRKAKTGKGIAWVKRCRHGLKYVTATTNSISTNIANGAVLSGSSVIWTAVPSGVPARVEFFIDGKLGATEFQSPYQFNGDPSAF
jgi:hypothetical protein